MYKYQEKLKLLLNKRDSLIQEEERAWEEYEHAEKKLEKYEKISILVKKAKQETQAGISQELSDIASDTLMTVLQEKFEEENETVAFSVEFGEKDDCNVFFLNEENEKFPVLDSRGFGLVDLVSVSLRLSFLLFTSNTRKFIVHDEPMRYLSKAFHVHTAEMFEEMSKNLGVQYIILTNEKGLLENARNVFKVQKVNKKSKITKE